MAVQKSQKSKKKINFSILLKLEKLNLKIKKKRDWKNSKKIILFSEKIFFQ